MHWTSVLWPGLLLAASFPAAPPLDDDERVVRAAGVTTSEAGLAAFFRDRTLTEARRREVEALVRELGSDEFAARETATAALLGLGSPALPFLRRAADDPDLEVRRRAARVAAAVAAGPGPALPSAAARLLARRSPALALPLLLAYLPQADASETEEAVIDALLTATPPGTPPGALILAALDDPQPLARGAAAHVVGRRGDAAQRALVRKRLADADAGVRMQAAEALLQAGDRTALPALVELLTSERLAWRAEDLLHRLAGESAPAVSVGDATAEGRKRLLAGWHAWVKERGAVVDLGRLTAADTPLGLTLGIEYNTGRVWECGRDGKLRWEIRGLQGPMDAVTLPGGRVLIVEGNSNVVTERDQTGKVLWKKELASFSPTGVQRLPDGGTFISSYSAVLEFDRTGKELYRTNLPGGGSNAIWRSRTGRVLSVVSNVLYESDPSGKVIRKITLPAGSYICVQDLPGDRLLLSNSGSGKVYEVDSTGKVLWEITQPGACGVTRLPGGNTVVATNQLVAEFDRSGRRVWEVKAEGYVRRVHRR